MKSKLFLLALVGCFAVVGCGSGDEKSTSTSAPKPEKIEGKVELAAFKGGYGIDFYEQAAKEFDSKHGTTTKVWGNPRVWDQLRPRIVGDNPPDLMYPGWGMDHWALAEEDQIMTLDDALKTPAEDGKGTWGDTFEPSILKLGQKDGKQYVLPYFFNVWGWWYNPDQFAKNGWKVPETYDDLLTLCGQIKGKGVAPITFQGKYPYYMLQGMLLPWAQDLGGIQVIQDIQNLKAGAWTNPAVLEAAKRIVELKDKGFFENGAVGMSHTESQTEFVMGKAAMIPCGTWLYAEMQKTLPPNAKMQFMQPPAVKGSGDPGACVIDIEPWMVPTKAKNPAAAIALFKYLTSLPKAKEFVEAKGTLMAIKGSDQAKLPETLTVASKVFRDSKTVWSFVARQWYPAMETDIENALTSLVSGQITPEKFCERAEAAAEKTRKDDSISKHTL